MLGDDGNKFFGIEDLEVLLALAMTHSRTVNDATSILDVANLLQRERITDDVLGQRFSALFIFHVDLDAIVNIESRDMPPSHEHTDKIIVDLAFFLEHL